MKLETAKRLRDAADACRELQHFSTRLTRDHFLTNRGSQLIIWKLIEIVGEALHQAEISDPTLADRLPELRDVVNTRNRITHGYDSVSFTLMWDIAKDDIPGMRDRIEALLADAPNIENENGAI